MYIRVDISQLFQRMPRPATSLVTAAAHDISSPHPHDALGLEIENEINRIVRLLSAIWM